MSASKMDPAAWPSGERDHYLALTRTMREHRPMTGAGETSLVMGSTGPFAQYVGRQALVAGGNAVDAAIAAACAQITLAAGCWVSFAGIASMVIHDPETGQAHSVNGPFRTFRAEDEPASIPSAPTPSGRTALVPGFFAAVHAAHQRFGRLSWAEVLEPSIWLAREGVPVTDVHLLVVPPKRKLLQRLPETAAVMFPDGTDPWVEGGWFRQPALAQTLTQVARQGPDYLYRGPWAEQFVRQVAADGGRVSLDDLAGYEAIVGPALSTTAYGHELRFVAAPDTGGVDLAEGLRLLEALEIGDPLASGENLYWLTQVAAQTGSHGLLPLTERLSDAHRDRVAALMRQQGGQVLPSALSRGCHSDYTVTADAQGMVVAMCHSINSAMWGTTCLNVGGISIPDAASFQQQALAYVPPGSPLPNPMNPMLAYREGEWVLASSSIGTGLMQTTLQGMHAVLALGLDVHAAGSRPHLHGYDFQGGDSVTSGTESAGGGMGDLAERIAALSARAQQEAKAPEDIGPLVVSYLPLCIESGVDADVVAAATSLGARLKPMDVSDPALSRGYWGALSRDPVSGRLKAVKTPGASGLVLGA